MYSTRLVMAEFCVPDVSGAGVPPLLPAAPGVPGVLDAPGAAGEPCLPDVLDVSGVPCLPGVPDASGVPDLPGVPAAPEWSGLPDVPALSEAAADLPDVPGAPEVADPPGVADVPAALRESDGLYDPLAEPEPEPEPEPESVPAPVPVPPSVAGVWGATRPEMSAFSRPGAWASLLARLVDGRSPAALPLPVRVSAASEPGLAPAPAPEPVLEPAPLAGLPWAVVLLVPLRDVALARSLPVSLPAVRLPAPLPLLPLAPVSVPPLRLVAAGLPPEPLLAPLLLVGLALRLRPPLAFPVPLPELRWRLLCVTAGLFVSVSVSGVPKNMPITSRMMITIRAARATRRTRVRMPRPVWVMPRHRRPKGPPPPP